MGLCRSCATFEYDSLQYIQLDVHLSLRNLHEAEVWNVKLCLFIFCLFFGGLGGGGFARSGAQRSPSVCILTVLLFEVKCCFYCTQQCCWIRRRSATQCFHCKYCQVPVCTNLQPLCKHVTARNYIFWASVISAQWVLSGQARLFF